ncbi:MAG: BolA family protein [Rickettsiaceae bacterium]|nr:BolA family protein [Rickettsiaceae bacterium]
MSSKLELIEKLLAHLEPIELVIEDVSHKHSAHFEQKNDDIFPSHIKIFITSKALEGLSLLARHKLIVSSIKDAYNNGLHSAEIFAYTPKESIT